MLEIIVTVDLTTGAISNKEISSGSRGLYGRGLALDLLKETVPEEAGRFSPGNAVVLVPGLFVGNPAPSACRIMMATCEGASGGMQICNMTGNLAQKLGSIGVAGLVIKGKAKEPGTVVHIDKTGVSIYCDKTLNGLRTSDIIGKLKERYERDSAIIGIGIAGDMMLPLSSVFCTYPDGDPEYHVPRNGFGDVWGAKNLRAVVVESEGYFGRTCKDPERFSKASKRLAGIIVNDEICGSALPTYGSITIMRILEGGEGIRTSPEVKRISEKDRLQDKAGCSRRINRNCAPMCVIGCLNRHAASKGRRYSSPAQVETQAAIENCFGVDDYELARRVQEKASEIGLVATEFVTSANAYARATGSENAQENLLDWLDELAAGSLTGRVIASRTHGVAELYKDIELDNWMDVSAAQEEGSFDIRMGEKYPSLDGLTALELLYAQIFVLENLGFCIFTSFALLDNAEAFDILAEMFESRTGIKMDAETLIGEARECIRRERAYKERRWMAGQKSNIPPFTRVLYRYFGKREEVCND